MSRTRTVALLLLAAGCNQPTSGPPPATKSAAPAGVPKTAPPPVVTPPPAAPTPPAVDLSAATAAAAKFLAALQAGSADVAAVAPEFQTVLAGGDAGKASWATERYLLTFAGQVSADAPAVLALPDGAALAVAPRTPAAGRVVLKLTKAGGDWQVAWLHQGPAGPVPDLAAGPDLSPRLLMAQFVEAVLTNQPRLAESVLTAAGRATVAPPLGADPLGFSRGILSQKLANFRGAATGYTLTGTTGELLGPGDEKRSFKLTLAAGGVADFEPR